MRPRWSPAISQALQQHGGSNRHTDRCDPVPQTATRDPVRAEKPGASVPEDAASTRC